MPKSKPAESSSVDPRRQYPLIAVGWLAFIALVYACATIFMVNRLVDAKEKARIRHRARMDPTMAEVGRTASEEAALDMGM